MTQPVQNHLMFAHFGSKSDTLLAKLQSRNFHRFDPRTADVLFLTMPPKGTIKNVSSVKWRPAASASSTTRAIFAAQEDHLTFKTVTDDNQPMACKSRTNGFKLGSDFSGISCESIACKALNLHTNHVFFCENLPAARKILEQSHLPRIIQEDVASRDPGATPKVDVFFATFPWQPFSQAGLRNGVSDSRGLLVENSLEYIRQHPPKAIIFENVNKILSPKVMPLVKYIKDELEALNYDVHERVSNVKDYLVPQNRSRWYMVALTAGSKSFNWPGKLVGGPFQPLTLSQIVKPLSTARWRALPPADKKVAKTNVENAYKKFAQKGINPFERHIVIDVGASSKFAYARLEMSPCLTRTRAGSLGYWDSVKGGPLNVGEMCKLMGFKKSALDVTDIKDRTLAACLGNGCSVTFLTFLIPEVLFAIDLISKRDLNLLRQRAEVHRLMLGMRP